MLLVGLLFPSVRSQTCVPQEMSICLTTQKVLAITDIHTNYIYLQTGSEFYLGEIFDAKFTKADRDTRPFFRSDATVHKLAS